MRLCTNCDGDLGRAKRREALCDPCVIERGTKICTRCAQMLPLTSFSPKLERGVAGREGRCKACKTADTRHHRAQDPERWRQYQREYRIANPEIFHRRYVEKTFGLERGEYDRLLEAQSGCCALCRRPQEGRFRLAVDHDHETGKVRGLLCRSCNTGLGNLRDDPDLLMAAALYVMAHREAVDHASV